MKANEVLRLLRVTRPTLSKYVKEGLIRTETMPNGQYNYNKSDVFKFLNGGQVRQTVIYASVDKKSKKKELDKQIDTLSQFCFNRGYNISAIYKDNSEDREDYNKLINNVLCGQVERVVVLNPTIISKVEFSIVKNIFNLLNTEIITVSECSEDIEFTASEIYSQLVPIFESLSPKLSTKRCLRQLSNLIEDAFDEEI